MARIVSVEEEKWVSVKEGGGNRHGGGGNLKEKVAKAAYQAKAKISAWQRVKRKTAASSAAKMGNNIGIWQAAKSNIKSNNRR